MEEIHLAFEGNAELGYQRHRGIVPKCKSISQTFRFQTFRDRKRKGPELLGMALNPVP